MLFHIIISTNVICLGCNTLFCCCCLCVTGKISIVVQQKADQDNQIILQFIIAARHDCFMYQSCVMLLLSVCCHHVLLLCWKPALVLLIQGTLCSDASLLECATAALDAALCLTMCIKSDERQLMDTWIMHSVYSWR